MLQEAWGNPTEVGYFDTPGVPWDLCISGKYAYIGDLSGGLRILDINDPFDPVEIGYDNTVGSVYAIAISGTYAYLSTSLAGLITEDVSYPSIPFFAGGCDSPGLYNITISGRYLFGVSGDLGLLAFDISDPDDPKIIDTCDTPGHARNVFILGRFAYIADDSGGLRIIDINNPTNLVELGYYDTPGEAKSVYVSGTLAYVADGSSGIYIIDVSDPQSPVFVSNLDRPGYSCEITLSGNDLYVADNQSIKIIDIGNPDVPWEVGFFAKTGLTSITKISVSGKYACFIELNSGFWIIDINGAQLPGLNAGSVEANNMMISEDLEVGNNLRVRNGLNLGFGGINSEGHIVSARDFFANNYHSSGDIYAKNRLNLLDGNEEFYTRIHAGLQTQEIIYTLPGAIGTSGQALFLGSYGSLYWGNVSNITGSGSTGHLAFWNGTTSLGSDNQLFWDNTNKRLGLGSSSPSGKLHIKGTENIEQLIIEANSTQSMTNPLIQFKNSSGEEIGAINTNDLTNIFIGSGAGQISTGANNVLFGLMAGGGNTNSGSSNSAIGVYSLMNNSNGIQNVAVGMNALYTNTTGSNNVGIGYYANVGANNYNNSIVIGANTSATASNQVRLGDGTISTFYCKGAWTATIPQMPNLVVTSDGKISRSEPTERMMREIFPCTLNSSRIYGLSPVSSTSIIDGSKYYGLTAEGVAK